MRAQKYNIALVTHRVFCLMMIVDNDGQTAVHGHGSLDMIRLILLKRCNADVIGMVDKRGETQLHSTSKRSNLDLEVAQMLSEKNADLIEMRNAKRGNSTAFGNAFVIGCN